MKIGSIANPGKTTHGAASQMILTDLIFSWDTILADNRHYHADFLINHASSITLFLY